MGILLLLLVVWLAPAFWALGTLEAAMVKKFPTRYNSPDITMTIVVLVSGWLGAATLTMSLRKDEDLGTHYSIFRWKKFW